MAARISQRGGVAALYYRCNFRRENHRRSCASRRKPAAPTSWSLLYPLERIGDWSAPKPIGRRAINLFCDEAFLTFDGQLSVIGWAISVTGISGVDIFLDGQQIGETEFGLPRHDVGDEYVMIPMARYSGFRLDQAVPDIADDAKLCITARNGIGDTGELQVAIRRAKARTDGKSVILEPPAKNRISPGDR